MAITNDYERDFNDTSFLKRPGRIDLIIFQNVADAGDGHPGLQRIFRNYLHTGGFENDLDLNDHDIINIDNIKGPSVDINNAELQQLSNIGAVTISNTQWGYLGDLDQSLDTGESPTFVKATLTQTTGTAPLTITSTTKVSNLHVDMVDSVHIAGLTNGRLIRYNSSGTQLENATVTESSGALGGITSITMSAGISGATTISMSNQLTNTYNSGAPFVITSTTKVSNLNVDMCDGQHLGTSNAVSFAGITSTGTVNFSTQNINSVANIYLADDIIHDGDTDTLISFGTNTIDFQAGGGSRIDISSSGVRFGATGSRVTHIDSTIADDSAGLITNAGVYAHTSSTSNPHQVSAQQAFAKNATVSETYIHFSGSQGINGGVKFGEDIIYDYVQVYCGSGGRGVIKGSGCDGISFRRTSGSANDAYCVKVHYAAGDHHKSFEVENGNVGGTNANAMAYFHDKRTGTSQANIKCQTDRSSLGTSNHHIEFWDSAALVGRIHSEVVYATFTGSHDSQTIEDHTKWEMGMILSSTGKKIGKATMGRALIEVKLTDKQKDKAVFGVFAGVAEPGHNFKGFDNKKPAVSVNAVGEGMILVTDTNGNIEIGDYIQSSPLPGLGEKQDDDLLHNYTVAKATSAINWNRIKAKNGIKKKLITCTYHCG